MIEQTLAIVRNTFFESIRQPIVLVLLMVATLVIILANPFSAFTMSDDQRMLVNMGLATITLCGTLLAAFIAGNVLGREIENKTALTVVSKPVPRAQFVIGKYLGVALAMMLATGYMIFVFLLVDLHGVLQTVRDPIHVPVVVFGAGAFILGIGAAIWCNYFYGKVFASSAICFLTPLLAIAYVLSLNFQFDFTLQPFLTNVSGSMWIALCTMVLSVLVLSAVAIAASTRCGQVLTLTVTIGVFLAGMLSDYVLARPAQQLRDGWTQNAAAEGHTTTEQREQLIIREIPGTKDIETETVSRDVQVPTVPIAEVSTFRERTKYRALRLFYVAIPNFQVFSLADALTQSHKIPPSYLVNALIYAALQITMLLSIAVALFQKREVG
jgi:ABC-2 type transport system permease protein